MVLVAEDYDGIRFVLKCWLEGKGYGVLEATNGAQAVEIALSEEPELILLDLFMPEMDGFAAARRIHEAMGRVPIVAMTAYGNRREGEGFRLSARAAGCVEYINKPINFEELGRLLQRLLPGGASKADMEN